MRPARGRWFALFVLLWPVAAMSALQDHFLYFPDTFPAGRLAAQAQALGLMPWPADDEPRGVVAEPSRSARATALIFHGNAGHALHRAWYAQILVRHGLRVILAEYPGYGGRTGRLGEESFAADGAATVAAIRRRYPGPLLMIGESLGAGVAAAVTARQPPDALLLITPWLDLASLAAHHYPWLPTRWLLRDRYDSGANLAGFRGPIVVVVAERDQVVPARYGRALYESLPAGHKRLVAIAGAGHNDWAGEVGDDWWRQLLDALLAAEGSPAPSPAP